MMKSTLHQPIHPGLHSAIIMDGNGRWAVQQGLPRSDGHREGVKTVRRIVECAPDYGISVLTMYDESAKSERKTKLTLYLVCITLLDQLNIVVMKTVFDFLPFRPVCFFSR